MSGGLAGRYVLGYPRAAIPVLRHEVFWWGIMCGVTAALVWGCLEALTTPPPRGWRTVAGVVLGFFTVGSALDLLRGLWSQFSLRIVPRFHPPLADWPDTWSHGRALIRETRALDQAAAAMKVKPLIEFGLEPDSAAAWFDCGDLRKTIEVLLAGERSGRSAADLRRIDGALAAGAANGSRVRLEIAGGDGMNGMMWEHLRREGY